MMLAETQQRAAQLEKRCNTLEQMKDSDQAPSEPDAQEQQRYKDQRDLRIKAAAYEEFHTWLEGVPGEGSCGVDQLRLLIESTGGMANVEVSVRLVKDAGGLQGLQGKISNANSCSVLLTKLKEGETVEQLADLLDGQGLAGLQGKIM